MSAVDPHVYLAGASGGVYALLAAHLAELIMNWSEVWQMLHKFLRERTLENLELSTFLSDVSENFEYMKNK